MANFKNAKNLLGSKSEYARYFTAFRGVDFSSDPNEVADNRFSYLVNMYKDYDCGTGGAIETIPGYRLISMWPGKIYGIHIGGKRIYVHVKEKLYYCGDIDEKGNISELRMWSESHTCLRDGDVMNEGKSTSFNYGENLYILDGRNLWRIDIVNNLPLASKVSEKYDGKSLAYLPKAYAGIDPAAQEDTIAEDTGTGYPYEQRNILNPNYRLDFVGDWRISILELNTPISCSSWRYEGNKTDKATFPTDQGVNIEVYQYGVKLPLAYKSAESGSPLIPSGYPNAIYDISPGEGVIPASISLVSSPPSPEDNTWNTIDNIFDYTFEEIENGDPKKDKYEWPYAFPTGYAGIEVVVENPIKNISGINAVNTGDFINKCTIAAVFDNHVFLSGNPDCPKHIFWNSGHEDENGDFVMDATYFGQNNFVQAGMTESPIIAMMPVGDALMVLKQDGDEEESLLLLTPESTGDDLNPKIYTSTRGHRGLGCLGPCYNFADDPIFITRFGVDALGHISTKYRRAIKHRSTLIDAKLLDCDLKKASITEWRGYLVILVDGKVFMADSRQMYNTDSGNTEYEWYYLEGLGSYPGEFDEYVFAELPVDLTADEIKEKTGGTELLEAMAVRNEYGVIHDLIGTVAFENSEEIEKSYITVGDDRIYYKEIAEVDEYGNETGKVLKYYVEPTGGKTGGEYKPSDLILAIGDDLIFANKSQGVIYKFNFDMRGEDGVIPDEYYDFDGRTIFSGCATKMDNCGIPHLTKTTVKRSMVVKAKSFKHSGFKIKIRTNRKDFTQVGRITSGWATFEDPDFKAYTFSTNDTNIFSINEREKKWVEKQIFIFSDGYHCPIGLHYLVYRYNIAGRYKE